MESLLISKAKFEEFRSLLLIPSSEDSFFLGSQLYFLHCKQLFDDHTNQVHYLDDSIFQQLETEDEKISWIQFFELLGVSKSPRLIAVVKDGLVLRELSTEFFEILVKGLIIIIFFLWNLDLNLQISFSKTKYGTCTKDS